MPTPAAKDTRDVRLALICAALLVALQVAAKSTRDALFGSVFSATELPRVMTAGAALSIGFALGAARVFRKFGPGRVVPRLLFGNALAFALEYALLPVSPRPVALVLYLHVSAVGAVVVSGFWSVVSERFDPHSLKTSVSRIGAGATFGGLCGGLFAERIAAYGTARETLLGLLALSLVGARSVGSLGERATASLRAQPVPLEAKALHSSYLRWLSAFVALTALTSSVVDFGFKARAMARYQSAEELVQFFGFFYTATSLLALLVQVFVTPRLLAREGLEVSLAVLPASLLASGLTALAFPGLPTQALMKGTDSALGNSLYRSAYEPLYTPLTEERKRSSKAVIDVVIDKFGDALGSMVAWGLVLALPQSAALGATGAGVLAAVACLLFTVRLQRGYVAELAASLRSGSLRVENPDLRDRTTRLTLSRTQLEIDRERLLVEIQGLRERGQFGPSVLPPEISEDSSTKSRPDATSLIEKVKALESPEARRVTQALAESTSRELRLAGFVIPLLARDDVAGEAMNWLASFGDRLTGQLSDALLTGEASAKLRRRLVRVLANVGGQRAVDTLARALEDTNFGVRRQAARGLATLARSGLELPVDRARIIELAFKDLRAEGRIPADQRLEHAFTVLGLVQDSEALALAQRALAGTDSKLRGTALEYLENVLPADIRAEIHSLIRAEPLPAMRREQAELLAELKRTLG